MTDEHADDKGKVKDKALDLLTVRGRTRAELQKRLAVHGRSETVEKVLDRLEETGLVDDAVFAKDRARSCAVNKGWGPRKIRDDLARRGLGSDLIEEALEAAYEEESSSEIMRRVAEKKFGDTLSKGERLEPKVKAKIMRFLFGRGFEGDDIRRLLDR